MKAQEGEADWPSADQRRTVRVMAGYGAPRSSIAAYLRINVPRLNALRRHALTVFGEDYATPDGTCIRDYVHVT
jgi:UDP-glucose 4-epimerase